jgi:hypothetical protein
MPFQKFGRCALLIVFSLVAPLALAQEAQPRLTQPDLNDYYRFPLSFGIEYQNLSPLTSYSFGAPFMINDFSADVRWPVPGLPFLQPAARLGLTLADSQSQIDPLTWSHFDLYGQLGCVYSNRFAKFFELGAELFAGVSESTYSNLMPDAAPMGSTNLLLEAGGRISLDPSYNFNVEIHPNLRYQIGLGELHDFDGPLFGIGFSVSYRLGQDPDAPAAQIRAIRFQGAEMPHAFAAMQSWYAKNPVGKIVLTNVEGSSLTDVEVSFSQKGYMDSPTPSGKIASLGPGESRTVELYALFNAEIFAVEGVVPVTGEVIVSYRIGGRPAEQRSSVSFDLYDKRAIVWDDDRKVAALITPEDGALKNYGGFIRQACKSETVPGLSDSTQLAMQAFSALGEIGCLYQASTTLPFAKVQGNPTVVDTVNLARETLKSGLGDCSDLTVLYCSLLESLAVDTGFITVPGHIYAAVDTKVSAKEYRKVHPEKRMVLDIDGEAWIPVEVTMIGKAGFLDAWRTGAEEWGAYDSAPEKRKFYSTKTAWETYRSVGLKETDLGLQYAKKENVLSGFRRDRDKLMELIIADYTSAAQAAGKKDGWNKAGIVAAQFLQYAKAEQAFRKALGMDAGYLDAQINLANVYYLQKRYADALATYKTAQAAMEKKLQGKKSSALLLLYINISRTYYQMEKYAEAKDYFKKASAIDAEKAKEFEYLQQAKAAGERGADQGDASTGILFMEENGEEE